MDVAPLGDPEDGVLLARMDEGKANAIGPAFFDAFDGALDQVEAARPRAVVWTGAGRHFCAGLDLASLDALDDAAMERFLATFERTFVRFFLLPFPVVAAVNGNAIAGGCVLAGAADHRVAAAGEALIGLNEARLGVSFPSVALEVPRLLLAPAAFRRVVLEGDLHRVGEALGLGLVDEVVAPDEVVPRAREVALRLSRSPTDAYAVVKRELRAPAARRIERDGAASRARFQVLWGEEEARELRREVLERSRGAR